MANYNDPFSLPKMIIFRSLCTTNANCYRRAITLGPKAKFPPASFSKIVLSTTTDEYVTGKVKFYRRDQAYGFIIPDDESIGNEVFVHRTSLAGSDEKDEFEPWQFLWRNDRVKFIAEKVEGKTMPVATNVTFEDGSRIPNRRKLLVR